MKLLIYLALLLGCCRSAFSDANQPAGAKGPLQWEKSRLPQALVVDGLWSKWFRVNEALDGIGYRRRNEIKEFQKYSVIVLVNVSTSALPKGATGNIRDFVEQGGGLVVLGGLASYHNGAYAGSPLEDMLPVSLENSYIEFYITAPDGAKLTRADTADWPLNLDFKAGPRAYYFHTLTPKSGAILQVKVGDRPALVSGSFGKGRVVACALTVNGEPAPGALPFWDWKDWPSLLGQAIDWAAGARPSGKVPVPGPAKGTGLKPLTEDEVRAVELGMEKPPADFVKRAVANPDKAVAAALFDFAVSENEEMKCGLDAVLPALLPYVRPEWAPKLKNLADGSNPNVETRRAALILLGACRAGDAYDLMLRALDNERTRQAGLDGLGQIGKAEAIPILKKQFTAALDPARLPDGPDRWKPAEFAAAAEPAAHAAIALYRLGEAGAVAQLFEFAKTLNLYRRIMWNATKRWPRDPIGQKILKAMIDSGDQLQAAWEFVANNIGPVPASQADAFMRYAMTADDPALIGVIVDTMEKYAGKLPKADWASLAGAKSGLIARMSKAMAVSGE